MLPGPEAIVQAINKALLDRPHSHGTGFVTLVYGHLTTHPDGGLDLTFVRAGHTLPLHFGDTHIPRPVTCDGSLLGIVSSPHLQARHLHLRPAESLVLYTDGITESRNRDGEQFGEQRLLTALTTERRIGHQEIIDTMTQALQAFTDTDIDDDQAVLVLTVAHHEHS
ncbi:PP2C family protein-serine/threonine phosphatase [Streptomyces sp. NRRL S-146]|uniref:PP2C family protein-serine/threonine phosphatase n=1 Tax=Streptomyces sp. NRRL S-146 TaxID=1463884 RepID=UPI00099C410F|nr:PP2C family protein-serine/threonine phosphatase [Streptomyces sp. NRRL S-146]